MQTGDRLLNCHVFRVSLRGLLHVGFAAILAVFSNAG